MPLSENQLRFFEIRGYLPVGQVSTAKEVLELKDEAAGLLGTVGESRPGVPEGHLMRSVDRHVRVALHLCHINEQFRVHALRSPAAHLVPCIFGEQLVVLTSLLFNKPARVGEALILHQDLPYYPYLRDDDLVTCWTALSTIRASPTSRRGHHSSPP